MRGLGVPRDSPTNKDTIVHLLHRCYRNLTGVQLRTEVNDRVEPVKFSIEELKEVQSLVEQMKIILSTIEDRFEPQHEVIRKPPPRKPAEKQTPLQEYMRKYK